MKKETKGKISRAVTAVIISAILIFVIAYQNRDKSLKGEIVSILETGSKDETRSIEGYAGANVFPYGSKAALVTTNTLMLMDEKGKGKAEDISVPSPQSVCSGDYILICDRGGRSFTLYDGTKEVYSAKTECDIISGRVNRNGYAAVAEELSGGNTEIIVYNAKGEAIYSWTMGSGEFVDMDLCADNTRLAISSVGDSQDKLMGEITVVRLDMTEKAASGFETDEIYFNVKINRDYTVSALGSEKLDLYNSDGSRRWSLSYDGRTLLGADISSPDRMILCCQSASSGLGGNSTEVEVVNRMGEITASTVFDGLCEHLCVSGKLFAVSAGKRIFIYDEKCTLKNELLSDYAVKGLALFKDGNSAFVLSGSGGNIIGK